MNFYNKNSADLLGIKPSYYNFAPLPAPGTLSGISVSAASDVVQPKTAIPVVPSLNAISAGSASNSGPAPSAPVNTPPSPQPNSGGNIVTPSASDGTAADTGNSPMAVIKKHKHYFVFGLLAIVAIVALTRK